MSGLVFLDFKKALLVNHKVLVEKIGLQSTPDNSNLQGKSKNVRVIGSSKKIAGSKEKFFLHSEHFNHPFNCRKVKETIERSEKIFLDYKSERDVTKHCLN